MRRQLRLPPSGPFVKLYGAPQTTAGVMFSRSETGFILSGAVFGQALAVGWFRKL